MDFHKLNKIIKCDSYLLSRIDETLDALCKAKYFSVCDCLAGFWQTPVEEGDKEKLAFIIPTGLYEFNVVPFGLTNAPPSFQRIMNVVLAGLTWECCLVYIDDILIYSATFEDHLTYLE